MSFTRQLFAASVAILASAPSGLAQGSDATQPGTKAAAAQAAVSTGFVETGVVSVQRNGETIQLQAGGQLFPGDIISSSAVNASVVIDGKSYAVVAGASTANVRGNGERRTSLTKTQIVVPASGGQVVKTTETKLYNRLGEVVSTTQTNVVLVGSAVSAALAASLAANNNSSNNSTPTSP